MSITHHLQFSNQEFAKQFAQCTLDPGLFNHEAHLRLAWIHLQQHDLETAIQRVCDQIIAYVTQLGARDKFNKTLTVAAVRAVHHFIQKSQSATFPAFIEEFPRLKYNFKDLMAAHYQMDIYHSAKAKAVYLEPDLLSF